MKIFTRPAPGTLRLALLCALFLLGAWVVGARGELKPYSTPLITGADQFIHATGTYAIGSRSPKEVNFYNREGQKELTVIRDSLGHWWVHWTFAVQDTEKTIQYEYGTLLASWPGELDRRINKAVEQGWIKDGELKVSSGGFLTPDIYCQPMKRRKP